MKNVIIRADSSSTIGTGHIMRDLVLAKRDFADDHVIFAIQNLPGNINHKIETERYEIVILPSDDIEELAEIAEANDAEIIVIDHYGIGYEEEQRLKEMTDGKLFVLDDTYEKHYCDILLNHNVYADPNRYKGLVPYDCELRCGSQYTLLRDEFVEAKKEKADYSSSTFQSQKLKVFIAMGGADTAGLNIPILKILENFPDIHANVVTTSANSNLGILKRYAQNSKNLTLHIDSGKIAEIMASSDFAIVTPSVTLNEVIYMELPFIAIQTADNQKEMIEYLKRHNYSVLDQFNREIFQREVMKLYRGLK